MLARLRWLVLVGLCGVAAAPSHAETYSYTVHHPTFGDIGTYTDRVERSGDRWRVDTTMHVSISALGVVLHREDAQRSQEWRDGRLVSFHGLTTTNGTPLEIDGAVKDGRFVVVTPSGNEVAPADVAPSDPWQVGRSEANPPAMMFSTKTGKVKPVRAHGGEADRLSVHGIEIAVRHYEISSDKRQDVWIDARGIPVKFRTVENGTPIDFELTRETLASLADAQPR